MAGAILGHRRIVGKLMPSAFNTTSAASVPLASTDLTTATLVEGLVQHDYVDPDVQVTILAAIDETGSAALGDIVAALEGHPKPAGAAFAMVATGIIQCESGIVDANSRLSRMSLGDASADPNAGRAVQFPSSGNARAPAPASIITEPLMRPMYAKSASRPSMSRRCFSFQASIVRAFATNPCSTARASMPRSGAMKYMSGPARQFVRLEGAHSLNTMRGYRSDFTAFEKWCDANERSSLPAAPETVAEFVDAHAMVVKPSTTKRRLYSIRKLHRLLNLPCPIDNEAVNLAMRRVRRKQPSRPKQAYCVTAALRDSLIAVCTDDLTGLRDALMVSIGFDMMGRRAEIVTLSVGDLTTCANGRYTAFVRRAKNDPEGAGRLCKLSEATLRLIDCWLLAVPPRAGPCCGRCTFRARPPATLRHSRCLG